MSELTGISAGQAPDVPPRAPSRPRAAPRTTHRLYIGGAFQRAASGRTFDVRGQDGTFLASAALAAGRDARAAVVAARAAFPDWSRAAGYDRGQALYRVAE
ncbi:MAG: aldehyde dehydrogenase family protein, partial [Trebonia sp.]